MNWLLIVCGLLLSLSAHAVTFDFHQWLLANGERGFNNSAPFTLTEGGVTLTAAAFELPSGAASHVYLDGRFNGSLGGMGVCSVLTSKAQCNPSSDDNISVDGVSTEALLWTFSQPVTRTTLALRDADHRLYANRPLLYSTDFSVWTPATTDALGYLALLGDATSSLLAFKPAGSGYGHQFYLERVELSPVPLPSASLLFGAGLVGLTAVARRRRAR